MIQVDTHYLLHEGGTKFYETVLLLDNSGPAMLIKRYGKTEHARTGGGETIIERGTASAMMNSRTKIINEKLRPAKGYIDSHKDMQTYGLHKLDANSGGSGVHDLATVHDFAMQHYAKSDDIDAIDQHFGTSSISPAAPPVSKAEPVFDAAIDRGELWGSF